MWPLDCEQSLFSSFSLYTQSIPVFPVFPLQACRFKVTPIPCTSKTGKTGFVWVREKMDCLTCSLKTVHSLLTLKLMITNRPQNITIITVRLWLLHFHASNQFYASEVILFQKYKHIPLSSQTTCPGCCYDTVILLLFFIVLAYLCCKMSIKWLLITPASNSRQYFCWQLQNFSYFQSRDQLSIKG